MVQTEHVVPQLLWTGKNAGFATDTAVFIDNGMQRCRLGKTGLDRINTGLLAELLATVVAVGKATKEQQYRQEVKGGIHGKSM